MIYGLSSGMLFSQDLSSRLTALWRFINFVLLLLLLLLLLSDIGGYLIVSGVLMQQREQFHHKGTEFNSHYIFSVF